ncbi:molybdate ABC transporter permease subunit [Psychrobacillus sp. FSL K6-2365]|jgi:molybdate transport system permease protein|uniref:molybdate ABC transporter permease subunit n=1 Tax=Psychrobacillus TaxID=1221880 RepID=UPI0008E84415|nr:molybdate ABC transporter permease subunit [Psychrobacillus psychrodurans]MCZ8540019.1 molybdate ABC transporter permease subunit [Psychrobacillus psychrodurans]SFM51980.1 molybdate transport system permease protein [Psychrobacillus psychrodurans]
MDLLLTNITLNEFFNPIWLSLKITVIASVIVIISGILVGRLLARNSFKGKSIVETLLLLPLVLSPTVVGFLLIVIFGRNSIFGQVIERLFNQPIIFTWWAAVIASVVVAFPLMYQSAKSGFQAIDTNIEEAARVDGASEWKILYYLSIPLASKSLMSGAILSFARALGEFGATLMFAGNIPGQTQTLPTAIYTAIDSGNMELAWLWVTSIIFISFIMLMIIQRNQNY